MNNVYPSELPCPQLADYKGQFEFMQSEVRFNRGNTRRRYLQTRRTEKYDLVLVLSTRQLGVFQSWANLFGVNWCYIPLVTHYSGFKTPHGPLQTRCRIMSDLSIGAITADLFKVRFSVEMDPIAIPGNVVVPSGFWVIAQTPAAPATPDWIVAQTPPAPSPDWVVAGRPDLPSAIVFGAPTP